MLNKSHALSRYQANSGENDSIFSIIVRTNRLHNFDEEICLPDNCCYENG